MWYTYTPRLTFEMFYAYSQAWTHRSYHGRRRTSREASPDTIVKYTAPHLHADLDLSISFCFHISPQYYIFSLTNP